MLRVDETAMGGRAGKKGRVMMHHSDEKVAKAYADVINELLSTPKEPKWLPDRRAWYFVLNKSDLKEIEGQWVT